MQTPEMAPENLLSTLDGKIGYKFKTGGLRIASGNMQHIIPGGTLFLTDRKIIHCNKNLGVNRVEFEMNSVKDLKGSETKSTGWFTTTFYKSKFKTYIYFKARIDDKKYYVRVKIMDAKNVQGTFHKHFKSYKTPLSVIHEVNGH